MIFDLTKGLIKVGSIISEAYYRNSQVSDEAKTAVGLNSSDEVNGAVPIQPIREYYTVSAQDIQSREAVIIPLMEFGETLTVDSLYVADHVYDNFTIDVYLPGKGLVIRQRNFANKTPYSFPTCPLPPEVTIVFTAIEKVDYFRFTFSPCKILDHREFTKLSDADFQTWKSNYSTS